MTWRVLLTVVTFIQHYRPHLACQKFTLRTDHGSLTWLRNLREPEGQLARWLEQLQELDFEMVHLPLTEMPTRSHGFSVDSVAVPVTALLCLLKLLSQNYSYHLPKPVTPFAKPS